MKNKNFTFNYLLILLFVFVITSCSKDKTEEPAPVNQYLTDYESVASVSAADIKTRAGGVAALVVSRGVKVYKLSYNTTTPDGKAILASGLVIYPDNATDSLTILSFQHGTITTQAEAPSAYQPAGNMEAYLGGTIGASLSKGYLVVMPDYLGFGDSQSISHPYQHKASLASASLDMLRAAKEFAAEMTLKVKKGILLAGYSEGGYATMALHQAIESKASGEFKVTASYPGAGPYDMVGTAQWVVSQNKDMAAAAISYYTWVMLTYNTMYAINSPLTDILTADNAAKVSAAAAAGNPLSAAISLNPTALFTANFILGIKNKTNTAFINAFQENNVYDWKPLAPVTLYHSSGDDFVPVLNSENALAAMQKNGATVNFVSLGGATVTHQLGAQAYLTQMITVLIK